jgi:methyl-accepting chemotaxis protein
MNGFKNLKLFHKVMLILVVYVVALVINTSIGISSLLSTQSHLVELESRIYDAVRLSSVNETLLQRADELFTQAVSFSEEELKEQGQESANKLLVNLRSLQSLDPEEIESLREIENNVSEYLAIAPRLVDAMLSEEPDFARLQGDIQRKATLFETSTDALAAYQAHIDETFKKTIGQAVSASEESLYLSSLVSAACFIILALLITYIANIISKTASKLSSSLHELSQGDGELGQRIPVFGEDELGMTASNFNLFMDKLSGIVRSVMNVSNPLLETSNDLNSTSKQVQAVTTDLVLKAREANHAMNEMTLSISEISESASLASSSMQETKDQAVKGLQIIDRTIHNSKDLNSQIISSAELVEKLARDTENVASILDVISSIAEQTNLLALNAAIEAARAGDQGRGFAVVADEVRALASKTGHATTEIRDVLNRLEEAADSTVNAMRQAKDQSEISESCAIETGDYLNQIKDRIEKVNEMNITIAAATEEQTMVVGSVNDIISTMADSVESTEASFDEISGIATNLLNASDSLRDSTSQFKL